MPAREIERLVGEAVAGLLADPPSLTRALRDEDVAADRIPALLRAVSPWRERPLDLVARVDLSRDRLAISMGLGMMAGGMGTEIRHIVPARIRCRGVEMRLVLDGAATTIARPDPALIKALFRAHRWFDDLASGRAQSLGEIAEKASVSDRYISHLLPLAFLAPDIVEAILAGTQPVDLTAETLTKRTELPLTWSDQEALFGFE